MHPVFKVDRFSIPYGEDARVDIYPPDKTIFGTYTLMAYGYNELVGVIEVTVSAEFMPGAEVVHVRFVGSPGRHERTWKNAFNTFMMANQEIFTEELDRTIRRRGMN